MSNHGSRTIVVAALFLIGCLISTGAASAQALSLQLEGGRVSLRAENVSVRQILEHWAQVGHVKVVNAQGVSTTFVTLQLDGVPERDALEMLLRNAAGYILGRRMPGEGSSSTIDRILIASTRSTQSVQTFVDPSTQRRPLENPPPVPSAQSSVRNTTEVLGVGDPGTPPAGSPRKVVFPSQVTTLQSGSSNRTVQPNPFGVLSGSSQPGTIAPVMEETPLRSGGDDPGASQ